MSYPHAIATGNAVIAAALAHVDALHAYTGDQLDSARECGRTRRALVDAVAAHRAATTTAHQQGPNIDTDELPS